MYFFFLFIVFLLHSNQIPSLPLLISHHFKLSCKKLLRWHVFISSKKRSGSDLKIKKVKLGIHQIQVNSQMRMLFLFYFSLCCSTSSQHCRLLRQNPNHQQKPFLPSPSPLISLVPRQPPWNLPLFSHRGWLQQQHQILRLHYSDQWAPGKQAKPWWSSVCTDPFSFFFKVLRQVKLEYCLTSYCYQYLSLFLTI